MPTVVLRGADGTRLNLAPTAAPVPPRLTIRLNNIVQAVIPLHPTGIHIPAGDTNSDSESDDDEDHSDDDADVLDRVENLPDEEESEDGGQG